jgi:hypothetical protein
LKTAQAASAAGAPLASGGLDLLAGGLDEAGLPLGDDDVAEQLLLLLFAGYETTASALSCLLLTLLQHPAELAWVPQGLVMGLYGLAALLLATYLWAVIVIDVGAGSNRFDRASGEALISRQGFRQRIEVAIPLRQIQAVKVEVRDGLSPQRRLALRVQGRRDLPLTRVGEPMPLADLELAGARLARFLGVPLEGL